MGNLGFYSPYDGADGIYGSAERKTQTCLVFMLVQPQSHSVKHKADI